jgi:hypothetical protein
MPFRHNMQRPTYRRQPRAGVSAQVLGFLLLLPILFSLRTTPLLAQSATASIAGRIVNGSAGNQPVPATSVTLYQFDGSNKRVVATMAAGQDGSFQFDDLEPGPSFQYAASAVFDGVTYASAAVTLQPGTSQQVDVSVYATTTDAGAIGVTRMSFVLAGADSKAGLLSIVESYHLHNGGNAAYIGEASAGQRQTLQVPLFTGARSLTALDGFATDDAIATATGFALTTPLLPGDSVLSFTYDLPYSARSLTLRRSLSYSTALAEVILPSDIRITSPQLTTPASVQLGGRGFDTIQTTNLAAKSALELDVSGLPSRPQPLLDLGSLSAQVGVVALILALLATGVIYQRQRARVNVSGLRRERDSLLRRVAELDDRAEGGAAGGAEYRSERALALARLADLTELLRGNEADRISRERDGDKAPERRSEKGSETLSR